MMALGPSHAWWAPPEQVGNVWEAAPLVSTVSSWSGPEQPGRLGWGWSALFCATVASSSGGLWRRRADHIRAPKDRERLVVVTTDPATLPERSTSLPRNRISQLRVAERAQKSQHSVADLAEAWLARVRFAKLDRGESYTEQVEELLGMGSLPGAQGPLHPSPLAAGVLRLSASAGGHRAEVPDIGSPPVVAPQGRPILLYGRYRAGWGERQAVRESPLSWPRALRKIGCSLAPQAVRNAPALLESVFPECPRPNRDPGVAR